MDDNAITSLPTDVFSGLSALQTLVLNAPDMIRLNTSSHRYFYNNVITSLPDNVFADLHNLVTLYVMCSGGARSHTALQRLQQQQHCTTAQHGVHATHQHHIHVWMPNAAVLMIGIDVLA